MVLHVMGESRSMLHLIVILLFVLRQDKCEEFIVLSAACVAEPRLFDCDPSTRPLSSPCIPV